MKRFPWKRILIAVIILSVLAGSLALYLRHRYLEQQIVMRVDGKPVYVSEAMIYYKIMNLKFEEIGGSRVFDLDMLGLDPMQTAIDRTLSSIARVKVAQPLAGQIYTAELDTVGAAYTRLKALLGEEYCQAYRITDELIYRVVEENYLAARYEESARFRTSDFDADIALGLQEEFGLYDELDQAGYLQTYVVHPMMFYTGQWVGEEWISYSNTQKEEILATAKAVRDVSDIESFQWVASYFSDDDSIENNPVFHRGAVIHPIARFGNVYLGQMSPEVQDVVQRTGLNTITEIITTDYGYLVLLITGHREAFESDYKEYESQLMRQKEDYREDLLEDLKAQRMEEEWERLEEESNIIYYSQRWSIFVYENATEGLE